MSVVLISAVGILVSDNLGYPLSLLSAAERGSLRDSSPADTTPAVAV